MPQHPSAVPPFSAAPPQAYVVPVVVLRFPPMSILISDFLDESRRNTRGRDEHLCTPRDRCPSPPTSVMGVINRPLSLASLSWHYSWTADRVPIIYISNITMQVQHKGVTQ